MGDAPSRYTSLRDYLRVVREQRLLIGCILVLFAGAALIISVRQNEVYEAKASLSFRAENEAASDIGAPAPVAETPEQRSAIRAQQVTELAVAQRAHKKLKTPIPPEVLANGVSAQPQARTHFVVVSYKSGRPQFAADVANAFATAAAEAENERVRDEYRSAARVLQRENRTLRKQRFTGPTRLANTDRINRLLTLAKISTPATVAVRATTPSSPISPKPVRNTVLGLLAGLTFGLLAAFMRDALDRRFHNVREINDELKLPLVGHVRDETLGRSVVAPKGSDRLSEAELEAFRIVRTNVDFLDVDKGTSSVVVTSALPEEGKSTVSGALAAAYATHGRTVLLVECDLRRPTLAKRLGVAPAPGLSDYMAGHSAPQDVLQTIALSAQGAEVDGSANGTPGPEASAVMAVITAGTRTPRPAEMLGSQRFRSFLEQVTGAYDIVILDSPPLLSVGDTLELIPNVDSVVLCVRASRTTREQARAAKAALDHFPPRPTGVVVTGLRPGDEADYGYYSYAYASGPEGL